MYEIPPVCVRQAITIVTDHKPLERLYKSTPPARIERWALKLQPYNFTVIYRAGKNNPANYMSRYPSTTTQHSSREAKVAEYINFVTTNAVPKALSVEAGVSPGDVRSKMSTEK